MGGFKKFRRLLSNIIWIVLTALVIVFILAIFLANKYEDELEELSIAKINQTIDTKISVEEIDVSFAKTFPYLSVVFTDVVVWSSHGFERQEFNQLNTDSLFSSEKVYLQFNPIDLIRSKLKIRRIYAVNGNLNILIDSNGKGNYKILKPNDKQKEKQDQKNWIFELEAFRLANYNIDFNNLAKNTLSSSYLDDLLLKGKFSKNEISIGTQTSLMLENFSRNGIRYAKDYEISLRLIMDISDSLASIQKGDISINNIRMNTSGIIQFSKDPLMDLSMESRNINISTMLESFPGELREKIPFKAQGRGDLAVKVKGIYSSTRMPSIKSVYVLRLDQISMEKHSFRNVKIKGNYSNGDKRKPSSTEIKFERFQILDRHAELTGNAEIVNLVSPALKVEISGELDAEYISQSFFQEKDIRFTGKIKPDFILRTRANSLKDLRLESFYSAGLSGVLGLTDFTLKKGEKINDINFNGVIQFAGESWYPEISMNYEQNQLDIKAQLDHVLKFLTNRDQVLWFSAIARGDKVDLNKIFLQKERISKTQKQKGVRIPKRLAGKITLNVGELDFRTFSATNVDGDITIRPGRIDVSSVSLNSIDGSVISEVTVLQNDEMDFYLKSYNELNNIEIQKLFKTFNNFGQQSLKYEHIKGSLTGNIHFNTVFDSTLKIKKDRIFTEADVSIRSGELIGFEPLEKLSGFVELEELEHIKFSTLTNTVLINNGQMTIPEMDINSSAFNITASGKHNFNGRFSYKLKILLSEILTGKAKRKNEEYYVMEDDRKASIYLSIDGTAKNYDIKYDKKEAVASIKEDLKEEKSTLKTILNEEFGWFNKDSSINNEVRNKPGFILEWEDTDTTDILKQENPDKKDRKKKKNVKKDSNKKEIFELEWDEDDG